MADTVRPDPFSSVYVLDAHFQYKVNMIFFITLKMYFVHVYDWYGQNPLSDRSSAYIDHYKSARDVYVQTEKLILWIYINWANLNPRERISHEKKIKFAWFTTTKINLLQPPNRVGKKTLY